MQNYPLLKGVQTNLYKCFLPQAWMVGNASSVAGFLHPEGIYDDPKGGLFRVAVYPRLRGHFQFHNELKLFSEVHHATMFSINVYVGSNLFDQNNAGETHANKFAPTIRFDQIASLYAPATIDACYEHDGRGDVPGIKNDAGKWNTSGHAERIIQVDADALATFAQLYDEPGTPPLQARLPALHTRQLLSVLEKFARQPRRLGDLKGEYLSLEMWHETNAQKDGTIRRETRFPEGAGQWVLSGPHFFVGTPFFKTPRAICNTNRSYDMLDLTDLPDDYLPRSNYVPDCDEAEYRRRTPRVPWVTDDSDINRRDAEGAEEEKNGLSGNVGRVTEFYRLISRTMIGPSSERTLISAITPNGPGHIDLGFSITLKRLSNLTLLTALFNSIVFDFFVKTTGKGHFRNDIAQLLPLPIMSEQFQESTKRERVNENNLNQLPLPSASSVPLRLIQNLRLRALALNCLTTHYADLWQSCYKPEFNQDRWTKADPRLPNAFFKDQAGPATAPCAATTPVVKRWWRSTCSPPWRWS